LFVSVNDTITVSGALPSAYNGAFTVTAVTAGTGAGGTITYAQTPTPGKFSVGQSHAIVTDGSEFAGVRKIIAGEIGLTGSVDYRSRLQFLIDLRATLESTGVAGGQATIPYDWWAYISTTFGAKPKSPAITAHNCLGTVGGVSGIDLDYWSLLATPQNTISGGSFTTTPYTAPYCLALPTSASAYTGVNTISISSARAVAKGYYINDITTPSAIPANTTITAVAGTSLTLSANVTGMGSGDTLEVVPRPDFLTPGLP
jgi:hypothetical protein